MAFLPVSWPALKTCLRPWSGGLDQRRPVLLRVCTDRVADAALRQTLRRQVEQALSRHQGSTKEH